MQISQHFQLPTLLQSITGVVLRDVHMLLQLSISATVAFRSSNTFCHPVSHSAQNSNAIHLQAAFQHNL